MRRARVVGVIALVAIASIFAMLVTRNGHRAASRPPTAHGARDVQTVLIANCPEGPPLVFSAKYFGAATFDIAAIRASIPDPLPPEAAGNCPGGSGNAVYLSFPDGVQLTYGPELMPRAIRELIVTAQQAADDPRTPKLRPSPAGS